MSEDFERTPPNDVDAEQCALGGMLLSPDALADVAAILKTGDFYRPCHGTIFDAITAMDAAGEPVDPVTVTSRLLENGLLTKLPETTYLHTLIAAVPTAANASWYARSVADKAQLRRLIAAGTRVVQFGYSADARDVADLVELAQKEIHEATTSRSKTAGMDWDDLAALMLDDIENASTRDFTGVSTSLAEGDSLTSGGFKPGELIIVAGRPGMGKSVYLVDVCRHAAFRQGLSVALFSLEMSMPEIRQRITAAEARVELDTLKSGELSEPELKRVLDHQAKAHGSRLHVDDSADLNLSTIRARARRIQQQRGLDLVAVDYLQLMTAATRSDSRVAEVGEISRGLKLLAKELGCPVVAAAQLNRGPEQRTDKRPHLGDLRESGSIENDADVVILLHRPGYYDKKTTRGAEADFIVEKNRHGSTDTFIAVSQFHYSRFVDYHPDKD
jgi:replicative DNA helicase